MWRKSGTCVRCSLVTFAIVSLFANLLVVESVIKSGYWMSWRQNANAIDTTLFTHVYYAFAIPRNDFQLDLVGDSAPERLSNFTNTLRGKNPALKILLSIGGGNDASKEVFPRIVESEDSRRTFINSAIRAARIHGFDGMDLDWEYPQNDVKMGQLGLLLEEWRAAIVTEAESTSQTPLLLAAAVYYSVNINWPSNRSYPVDSMVKNMDWINLMTYEYHGSWESVTGAHTALFDQGSTASTDYGLNTWINAGVPRHMLVLGLAMFGKVWDLLDPNVAGIGAPTEVPTGENNMAFSEILEFNNANGARVVRDEETQSVYAIAGKKWIGYDDEECIRNKVLYAREHGIRGYFFWEIGQDSDWRLSRAASNV